MATRRPRELSPRRAAKLYARGARLRCPHCGGGGLLKTWFELRPNCPTCGLRLDRGEEDFFLGAMMMNLVVAELLLALALTALVIVMWPQVPWTFLQWGGIALMILAPIALYPFSKTLWLAADIQMRPVTPEEIDWARSSDPDAYRAFDER